MAGWYNSEINTKRNISKFTQPFARLFKREKTTYILNGQVSTWTNATVGVPQGFTLGSLLFLIYTNDLSEGLSTNAKLFSDNTSLYFAIHDSQISANNLNKDLEIIHNWVFHWILNEF